MTKYKVVSQSLWILKLEVLTAAVSWRPTSFREPEQSIDHVCANVDHH
jgi:hypothetical protein